MRVKHRNFKHGWRNDFTRQVFYMDTSGRQTSPQFLFKSPQKDNIPLHGRRWNAGEKKKSDSAVEVCAQIPLLPDGPRAQNLFFKKDYDLRTQNTAEWGSLPRYVDPAAHGEPLLPAHRRTKPNHARMPTGTTNKHVIFSDTSHYFLNHFVILFSKILLSFKSNSNALRFVRNRA